MEEMTAYELQKIEADAQMDRERIQKELQEKALRFDAECLQEKQQLELLKVRRVIENEVSDARVRERLIELLPEVVSSLPTPKVLKTISLGSTQLDGVLGSLTNMVNKISEPA